MQGPAGCNLRGLRTKSKTSGGPQLVCWRLLHHPDLVLCRGLAVAWGHLDRPDFRGSGSDSCSKKHGGEDRVNMRQ